jgi:hypothetical protein
MPPPLTDPLPATCTVSGAFPLKNLAVTLLDWLRTTVQVVDVPPQAPLQPLKVASSEGVAVSVTLVPIARFAAHVLPLLPQLIVPPPLLTFPSPDTVTESCTACANVAVTDLAADMSTAHVGAEPEHAPPQPVNVLPLSGEAVRSAVELTA